MTTYQVTESTPCIDRQAILREDMWDAQEPIWKRVREHGISYFDISREHFNLNKSYALGCMEERHKERKIGVAGAGIFWTPAQTKIVAERIRRKGIRFSGIAPHHDCGAEGIIFQGFIGQGMNEELARNEIRNRRHTMHEIMLVPLLPPAEIKCVQFHIARSLVLIGTDLFDVSLLPGLYPFQVNARYSPSELDTYKQVRLALQIATGPNGYGNRFTPTNPFLIVIVGHPTNTSFGFAAMAHQMKPLIDEFKGAVQIVGSNVDPSLLK